MWRPAAVVTLPYPDWQPGNQSCDASEEDEQRRSPEAAGPAAAIQHPQEASGSWRAGFSWNICLDLLHQFASGWTEDAVFNVPHSRQTSQQLRRIKSSLFLRFYPSNLGSLSTKRERLACRPARPLIVALPFSLCLLSLNVPLCPRCL